MVFTTGNSRFRRIGLRLVVAAGLLAAQTAISPAMAAGPGFSADRMVDRMASKLNLTDAQVQQVRQIFQAHQDEMTARFQALRTAHQALRQATLQTPVNEGAIRNAAQALAQAEGDSAILKAQIRAQILPLLNADQQQKLTTFESGAHGRWKGHGSAASE